MQFSGRVWSFLSVCGLMCVHTSTHVQWILSSTMASPLPPATGDALFCSKLQPTSSGLKEHAWLYVRPNDITSLGMTWSISDLQKSCSNFYVQTLSDRLVATRLTADGAKPRAALWADCSDVYLTSERPVLDADHHTEEEWLHSSKSLVLAYLKIKLECFLPLSVGVSSAVLTNSGFLLNLKKTVTVFCEIRDSCALRHSILR